MLAFANADTGNENAEAKALDAFRKLIRLRQGKRMGWGRFCEKVGVDRDAITKRFLDLKRIMEPAEVAFQELESDGGDASGSDTDRIAAEELNVLIESWRERTD